MTAPTPVALETGRKRVFASALDWPGWCRSGKTDELALAALAAAAPRYAVAAVHAGVRFRAIAAAANFDVVERLPGSASTDFGVPGSIAAADHRPLTVKAAGRMTALVAASWAVLADVADHSPPTLRKGPRGGGRDRDAIVQHVVSAEAIYARKLGVKMREPAASDLAAVTSLRSAILDALSRATDGRPLVDNGWPARYAARRIAWHVLDHAWEIEDRRG